MQDQTVIVTKFAQGLPGNIETILTDEDIKYGQKTSYGKLSIPDDFFIWIVPAHYLFPSRQVSFVYWNMKGFMLKSIQLGMAQQAIVISIVHAKDARQGALTIFRKPAHIQVIQGRKGIQDGLLGFQKDLVDPQQVFGAAFDALSDESESLHQTDDLLSRSSQHLFVRDSSGTRGEEEIHFVSCHNDWKLNEFERKNRGRIELESNCERKRKERNYFEQELKLTPPL
jgi:hypothetical protein